MHYATLCKHDPSDKPCADVMTLNGEEDFGPGTELIHTNSFSLQGHFIIKTIFTFFITVSQTTLQSVLHQSFKINEQIQTDVCLYNVKLLEFKV